MNKNQIVGFYKKMSGKLQKQTGKLSGSQQQQFKGLVREVEGMLETKVGDVQQAFKRAADKRKF